jgi:murein DD-endopeptidase MepM/ murein hydrolase activator NlpD
MIVLTIVTVSGNAVYQIVRPVVYPYGYINQYNLYGEGDVHKGIDFPTSTNLDTNVIAIADGQIVDLRESEQNFCDPRDPDNYCTAWGNYVLIRHTQRHYDRTTSTNAYVYSLYLHLTQWSVPLTITNQVVSGQVIGQSDDTGKSDRAHSHLQIVIHPQSDRTLATLDSENKSRNPELWLIPYAGTGTVIGKVTNTNGDALGGRKVYGLDKPILGGYDYESSLTYNDPALNPDDILVENWGTTDVTPGRYQVTTDLGGI